MLSFENIVAVHSCRSNSYIFNTCTLNEASISATFHQFTNSTQGNLKYLFLFIVHHHTFYVPLYLVIILYNDSRLSHLTVNISHKIQPII